MSAWANKLASVCQLMQSSLFLSGAIASIAFGEVCTSIVSEVVVVASSVAEVWGLGMGLGWVTLPCSS